MSSRNTPVEPIPGEEWRPLEGFAPYMVSDHGRIKRLGSVGRRKFPSDRLVITRVGTTGYLSTVLTDDAGRPRTVKVHRAVARAFIGPIDGRVINHLDGVKANNVVSNLEITDRAGNVAHATATGLIRSGERHHATKLTAADVAEMRRRFAAGESGQSIADWFGITRNYAYEIKRNEERAA